MTRRGAGPGGWARRHPWRTAALAACLAAAVSAGAAALSRAGTGVAGAPRTVLVVGDSLVAQAFSTVRRTLADGVTVVAYGGSGSAPCDWRAGYRDPISGRRFSFGTVLEGDKPGVVALAFSGNAGFSGPAHGCVDADRAYGLAALLASYRVALEAMASAASAAGAMVYLVASPPRNPATPPGRYLGSGDATRYDFNGVPELDQMLRSLADSARGRAEGWRYDPSAAAAVSGPDLAWREYLPCRATDRHCVDGLVRVRAGDHDAIHLDTAGAGAVRYREGMLREPLAALQRST